MMGTRSGSVEIIEFCIEYADTEACVQIAWVIMTFCWNGMVLRSAFG